MKKYFEQLNKEEIIKENKKYKSNEIKQNTFKDVINNNYLETKYEQIEPYLKAKVKKEIKTRQDIFEVLWNSAMSMERGKYAFSKIDDSLSKFVRLDVLEFLSYKDNILMSFFQSQGKTFKEKYYGAERNTYEERTENFFKKYGDEKYKDDIGVYGGQEKTLNEWFEDYKQGKISREDMNFIISDFKDLNEEWFPEDYRGKNRESADSIINEFMEQ